MTASTELTDSGLREIERSPVQIIYENSGCVMPRDMHRNDYMMKFLLKFGMQRIDALAVLCSLTILRNAGNSVPALNLNPEYMAALLDCPPEETSDPDALKEQNAAIKKTDPATS